MSDTVQIIVGVFLLAGVYLLTRRVHLWRMRRAYFTVLEDLKKQDAQDPSSAVSLPYVKTPILRAGMRDFRPKAVEFMVSTGIIAVTEEGKYYLTEKGRAGRPVSDGEM